MDLKQYIRNVGVAFDRLCNAILLGDPKETMSSRMGRHVKQGSCVLCKFICGALSILWPDHCINNIEKKEEQK
jgi:hypothetical protein